MRQDVYTIIMSQLERYLLGQRITFRGHLALLMGPYTLSSDH